MYSQQLSWAKRIQGTAFQGFGGETQQNLWVVYWDQDRISECAVLIPDRR